MPEIHPDWDVDKATAHLAMLHSEADRAESIADAFEDAAEEHRREAERKVSQIAHCERMFAKPRTTPTTPEGGDR
jgi:hypothetical protein